MLQSTESLGWCYLEICVKNAFLFPEQLWDVQTSGCFQSSSTTFVGQDGESASSGSGWFLVGAEKLL